MNLEQIRTDIDHWIETFLEVPNPALGGWSPCPYARRARLDRSYQVRVGTSAYWDLAPLSWQGIGSCQVVIYAYNPQDLDADQFEKDIDLANRHYLVPHDLIALADHPDLAETVNGVVMNQGRYALILIQSLTDLDQKSAAVARKGFYDSWPEPYLEQLFQHRQDPRS
jgi:hypothetical protein